MVRYFDRYDTLLGIVITQDELRQDLGQVNGSDRVKIAYTTMPSRLGCTTEQSLGKAQITHGTTNRNTAAKGVS